MDCYKCDNCGYIFDEFEMDFNFAQQKGVTLCGKCKDEYLCREDLMRQAIEKQPKKK